VIPLVVRVENLEVGGDPEQFAFIKSPVRIGRGELNDLPLLRPFVSTYHGLVQFDDESASYVDVGSTNGSVIDGRQVEKNVPMPVAPGSELLIGTFRLTFTRRMTAERMAVPKQLTVLAMRLSALRARPEPSGPEREAVESEGAPVESGGAPVESGGAPVESGGAPVESGGAPVELGGAPALVAEPEREPVPDEAAVAAAEAAIEAASLDLEVHYASYRGAWEHMRAAVEAVLDGLDGQARSAAIDRLVARYPGIAGELEGTARPLAPGAEPARGAPPPLAAPPPPAAPVRHDLGAAALQILTAFGESYVGEAPLATPRDLELVLERVADVLETFGRSFVELHRGYEEFGSEMGVRAVQGEGVIHRARDARQLLAYLLDLQGEGRERELQRAFADFMLHQVALLRGVVEGGRALLGRLSPDEVSATAPKGMWPLRAAALWKAFEERFHELADEESALTEALFGREFSRAYAAIVGGGAGDGAGESQPRAGRGGGRPRR
jgi:type VI secretion system protein